MPAGAGSLCRHFHIFAVIRIIQIPADAGLISLYIICFFVIRIIEYLLVQASRQNVNSSISYKDK